MYLGQIKPLAGNMFITPERLMTLMTVSGHCVCTMVIVPLLLELKAAVGPVVSIYNSPCCVILRLCSDAIVL